MVHALEEAWRVLVPDGIVVDVRPLSQDVPLEVVFEGGVESAGMLDLSPGLHYDRDSDRAIDEAVSRQIFTEQKLEYFGYSFNWDTVEGLDEDLKENWVDEIIVPEGVWGRMVGLFNQRRPGTKIRVVSRMKLGIYIKNE